MTRIETLAAETGLEPRSVKRAIRELERSGWWHINNGTGRGHTNSLQRDEFAGWRVRTISPHETDLPPWQLMEGSA